MPIIRRIRAVTTLVRLHHRLSSSSSSSGSGREMGMNLVTAKKVILWTSAPAALQTLTSDKLNIYHKPIHLPTWWCLQTIKAIPDAVDRAQLEEACNNEVGVLLRTRIRCASLQNLQGPGRQLREVGVPTKPDQQQGRKRMEPSPGNMAKQVLHLGVSQTRMMIRKMGKEVVLGHHHHHHHHHPGLKVDHLLDQ